MWRFYLVQFLSVSSLISKWNSFSKCRNCQVMHLICKYWYRSRTKNCLPSGNLIHFKRLNFPAKWGRRYPVCYDLIVLVRFGEWYRFVTIHYITHTSARAFLDFAGWPTLVASKVYSRNQNFLMCTIQRVVSNWTLFVLSLPQPRP